MPDGLTSAEVKTYQALAYLAARYKLGAVTAEQAQRERKEIDRAFDVESSADKANKWIIGLRKRIERAHDKYRLNRTIENADLLSGVIDGFIREVEE